MKVPNIILTILFAFGLPALLPSAQAVTPPPGGGYPGINTAEGQNALFSLTTGVCNTALGVDALFTNDATGNGIASYNSAFGSYALFSNRDGWGNTAFGSNALF